MLLAYVQITDRCNAKCSHCFLTADSKYVNSITPSFEDLGREFKQLKNIGVSAVTLSGGEPTLHPDFCNVVGLASIYFEKVNVISNGSQPSKIKEVVDQASLWVSLDYYGYRHDETRGIKGLFYNYQQLADYVNIRTTFLKDNFVDVMNIAYAVARRNKQMTIAPYRGLNQDLAPTPQNMAELLKFIFKNGYEKNVVIDDCSIRQYLANKQDKKNYVGCNACEGVIQVTAKGMITPCPFLPQEIGNLYDDNINEKIFETRKQLLNAFNEKCQTCSYQQTCGGCKTPGSNTHCFLNNGVR